MKLNDVLVLVAIFLLIYVTYEQDKGRTEISNIQSKIDSLQVKRDTLIRIEKTIVEKTRNNEKYYIYVHDSIKSIPDSILAELVRKELARFEYLNQ